MWPLKWRRQITITVLAAVAYLLAAEVGLRLAVIYPNAAALWPSSGIALAVFLLAGYYAWPGIFLGAFLVNLTVIGTVWTSLGVATGNTLEGIAGAYLVRRFANGADAFDRPADVFMFAFVAAVLSTTVSPTVGVASLAASGLAAWTGHGPVWLTWWLGDATGVLVVTPLIVLWSRLPLPRWNAWALGERALFLAVFVAVAWGVFDGRFNFAYAVVPFVVWAAFRFDPREAVTVVVLLFAIAIWGTANGRGPLVGAGPNESLLLLRVFLGIMMLVALPVSAVVAERQRLYRAERVARRQADQALGRAARLQAVTAALARAVGTEDVARVAVEHGMQILGARAGGLALVTPDRAALRAVCDVGFDNALVEKWSRVPLSTPALIADAVRSGAPIFLDDGEAQDQRLQRVWQAFQIVAQAAIPLMIGERAIGVAFFAFTTLHSHTPEEREFMLALAGVCAQALERAQLCDRERQAAATLRRAFLPGAIPQVPGAQVDAAYLPGTQEAWVGGDWYDVFQLHEGRVALSIGDVVGHGLTAAVVMGQLRQAMWTAAMAEAEPAAVLDRAHELLAMGADTEAMATAIFGVFDPVELAFTYAAAGHPFGLLCTNEGAIEAMPPGEGPLGIDGYIPRTTRRLSLPLGALLVLYTDGLVETARDIPGEEAALHRAVRAAAREGGTDHAHRILEGMLQGRPATDDIAVITVAVQAVPADRLELAFRAEPRSVRLAREALRQFAARLGLTDGQGRRAGVALSEAMTNVVEHAYGASVGTVRVRAWQEGAWLRVEVEDEGQWRAPRPDEGRGYGIPTMRAMMDTVDIDRSPSGTLVRLGMSLAERPDEARASAEPVPDGVRGAVRTGPVASGAGEAPAPDGMPADVPVAQTGPFQVGRVNGIPVVEVAGDVDLSNAHMLQTALEQASRTEQRTVVVSLGGSAYFDSQGMHMLLRFNRRLEISRRRLVVVVPWHHPLKAVLDALGNAVNVTVVQTLAQALAEAQSGR